MNKGRDEEDKSQDLAGGGVFDEGTGDGRCPYSRAQHPVVTWHQRLLTVPPSQSLSPLPFHQCNQKRKVSEVVQTGK